MLLTLMIPRPLPPLVPLGGELGSEVGWLVVVFISWLSNGLYSLHRRAAAKAAQALLEKQQHEESDEDTQQEEDEELLDEEVR